MNMHVGGSQVPEMPETPQTGGSGGIADQTTLPNAIFPRPSQASPEKAAKAKGPSILKDSKEGTEFVADADASALSSLGDIIAKLGKLTNGRG